MGGTTLWGWIGKQIGKWTNNDKIDKQDVTKGVSNVPAYVWNIWIHSSELRNIGEQTYEKHFKHVKRIVYPFLPIIVTFLPNLTLKSTVRPYGLSPLTSRLFHLANAQWLVMWQHHGFNRCFHLSHLQIMMPKCSMYGICTYIWAIFGVNIGKYAVHGASE